MTKSESFNWHRTSKICNGIYDFGLLRDKPDDVEEQKPKLFPIYFSRTVFVVGIIAGVTFMVCLILADKYHKSVTASHHYASFIYEKEREKLFLNKNSYNLTNATENTDSKAYKLTKLQNISKHIPIEEINQLIPITTVLHSVNSSDRNSRTILVRHDSQPNLRELNKNISAIRLREQFAKKIPLNLADLLRRTEVKKTNAENAADDKLIVTTPDTNTLQFAQLESYKHYQNTKNLQDILKYVNCPTAEECSPKSHVNLEEPPLQHGDELFEDQLENEEMQHDQIQQPTEEYLPHNFNSISTEDFHENDLLYADSSIPIYLPPSFPVSSQRQIFDQFYNFRASSPLEINDMDQSQSSTNEISRLHRFSNRIYQSPSGVAESPRLFTESLEPYLKPPTPPPTTLSFTPSYTTSIFHGLNESPKIEEVKPEAIINDAGQGEQVKPISLMVEIFPANDYELPSYEHNKQRQYLHRHTEDLANAASQVQNPPWLPWKLSPYSQNRMRLFVNLFPQLAAKIVSSK